MTYRWQVGVLVTIVVITLPIIIVRAQAEGEAGQPADNVIAEQTEVAGEDGTGVEGQAIAQDEVVAEEADNATTPLAEEGSVLGAETVGEEVTGEGEQIAVGTQPQESTEEVPMTDTAAATTSPSEPATVESTATSTEPVGDSPAVPIEEPFVLQPAVKLRVNGSSVAADISLDNLTCKRCDKVLPAMSMKAYYTAWYPNDGPEYKEADARLGEQEVNVSDVALWSSRAMSWSANDIAPGRYYFVVVVDPHNANDAYRMHRTEFAI